MTPKDIYFTNIRDKTEELWLMDFGMTIPTSAVINGVTVTLKTSGTVGVYGINNIINTKAFLITPIGGVAAISSLAQNRSDPFFTNLADDTVSQVVTIYGSNSDTWGLTLTPTDVNTSSKFGVMFAFQSTAGLYTGFDDRPHLRIEEVSMTVFYSLGGITTIVQENFLYGSKTDGKIYVLSEYVFTDDIDAILFVRRSGMITYNTLKQKRVNRLHVRMTKGLTYPTTQYFGNLYIWYNDNYQSKWNDTTKIITIPLTSDNNPESTSIETVIHRLGKYRTRQYQFMVLDPLPFVLIEVEEEADILRD